MTDCGAFQQAARPPREFFTYEILQAKRAERAPESVDPEFLKMMRNGLGGSEGSNSEGSGLHNLAIVAGVVAGSGFIAGKC